MVYAARLAQLELLDTIRERLARHRRCKRCCRQDCGRGIRPGTVIFLDIERMDAVPQAMRDYYRAWTARVIEDGRFRPAYYAHSFNASLVYTDVKKVLTAAGVSDDPPFWIASERGFAVDKDPSEVGHAFAQVWQGLLDVVETHNGVRLPIDVNVAQLPSPSENNPAGE